MTKTVTTPPDELTGYAATAAELRRIADAIETTMPPGDTLPFVKLHILPAERTAEAVDTMALAMLGEPGETERFAGEYRHVARCGPVAGVRVSIHASVPGPPDERDVELERLRAENAELVALRESGLLREAAYGRAVDNGDAAAEVPTGVEGGPVTGRATVADTSCLAVLPSGVRCDEPIFWNPSANAWWHEHTGFYGHTATGPSVPPQDVVDEDDDRACAHRGDGEDCECNGNDQPVGGE
jgi:hypothetical protein